MQRGLAAGVTAISILLAAPDRARGSHEHPPPIPAEAPRAVPLFDDLGNHHHPVSTADPLAQRYFDQGLRLVYAFNHDEARRAFEEAARLDPSLAMAHWGVALTLGPNINLPTDPERERAAHAAAQRALAAMAGASAAEKATIRALAVRYDDALPDRRARDVAYANAMRELARAYPDDLDAATLFAEALMDLRPWDLWTRDGAPQPGTEEIVATLESVLARDPDHPGANHYYIHAVEASPFPERALPSADRLLRLMPGAGHLVHMPSHIYMRTGRYAAASDANARAIEADKRYIAVAKPEGFYPMMYVPHNIHFLSVSSAFEGRRAEAVRRGREAAESVSDSMVRSMPMLESFRAAPYFAMVRFGAFHDLLAVPAPPEDHRYVTAIHHFSRGVALAHLGRVDEAEREQACFEAARAQVSGDSKLVGNSLAAKVLDVASEVLAGDIAAAEGRVEDSIAALRRAVEAEDTLAYGEPPDWPIPARHALGAALLAAGRASEAAQVYWEDLLRNPENGWALFGLEESLRRLGHGGEADAVHARFVRAFARTDVKPSSSRY